MYGPSKDVPASKPRPFWCALFPIPRRPTSTPARNVTPIVMFFEHGGFGSMAIGKSIPT